MYYDGIMIATRTLIIIGLFHPMIIKAEYYFSKKIWPVFVAAGIILIGISVTTAVAVTQILLAVTGAACLWSVKELHEQEQRVKKGWFPANPRRK